MHKHLSALAKKLNIEKRVLFPGAFEYTEIPYVYKDADKKIIIIQDNKITT